VAWFLISNHCAFAVFEKTPIFAAHTGCHGVPAEQPTSPSKNDQTPCCKVLRATLVKTDSSIGASSLILSLQPYQAGIIVSSDQIHWPQSFELDTGPPFGGSFAEIVLQRSILAHAPPFVV
jgi:hypothetical protein